MLRAQCGLRMLVPVGAWQGSGEMTGGNVGGGGPHQHVSIQRNMEYSVVKSLESLGNVKTSNEIGKSLVFLHWFLSKKKKKGLFLTENPELL